jgi:hypothetical protein
VTGHAAGAQNEADRTDSLARSWKEIVSLQNSARQFNARLVRTAPRVAELAVAYPALRDALKVVNVLVHNVSLAQDVLGRMPLPEELAEAVT